MKKWMLLLAVAASWGAGADPLFPMPSVVDITDDEGLAVAVGAGLEYEGEYDGADEYGLEFEPAGAVQWRRGNQVWFFEGQEAGWRGRIADHWLLQGAVRFEGGREESEAPELAGLGDTDNEAALVFEARRAIGGDWANWGAVRVMGGGSDLGALGVVAAGHTFPFSTAGSGIDVFGFVTFGSSTFINRDFGIDAVQSVASGLAQTDLGGGYRSVGVQAIARQPLGERWQLQAEAGYERYSSDIADSPIALDSYEAEIGVSLLYLF